MSKKKITTDEFFWPRLVQVMEHYGIKQAEFARRTGLSAGFVTDLKKGRGAVSQQTFEMICRTFTINENWLVGGEGEMLVAEVAENGEKYQPLPDPVKKAVKVLMEHPDKQWELYALLLERVTNGDDKS